MATVSAVNLTVDTRYFAAVAGFFSHIFFFIRGEHHLRAPFYIQLGCLFSISLFAVHLKDWFKASIMEIVVMASRGEKPIIVRTLYKLVDAFQDFDGKPINVTEWISYFAFDTGGELAFNKSFDMLDKHEWTGSAKVLRHGMGILGYATPAPWLAHVAFSLLPKSRLMWHGLLSFSKEIMGERLEKDLAKKDASYWMIEAERQRTEDLNMNNLYGDAFSMIIAGSHSLATIVIFSLLELVKYPEMQNKICKEFSSLEDRADTERLAGLEFLNAFINEVMRLYPVTPTGGIRLIQDQGVVIGDTFIPAGTTIVAPRWTLGRRRLSPLPSVLSRTESFRRHACPGKELGLMEIRLCLAMLVSKFEIEFAAREDGIAAIKEMTDSFTANPGPLQLRFTPRIG
ncbi:MAG: hypothetical protein Q9165_003630 [Trypethelium subeluteriae]